MISYNVSEMQSTDARSLQYLQQYVLSSIYWVSFPLVFNRATSLRQYGNYSLVDANYFIKGLNTFKFVYVANEREYFETQLVGALVP